MALAESKTSGMSIVKKLGIVVAIMSVYSFFYDLFITKKNLEKICKAKNAGEAIGDTVGSLKTMILKILLYIVLMIVLTISLKIEFIIAIVVGVISFVVSHLLSKLVLFNKPVC